MENQAGERVREILSRIGAALDLQAAIEVNETAEAVDARYVGDDVGVLIGHHGSVIDAIQHLAYRIAFHGAEDRKLVSVDAGGYRERRATALRSVGEQAADAAIREQRPVALDPMSPSSGRWSTSTSRAAMMSRRTARARNHHDAWLWPPSSAESVSRFSLR